MAEDKLPTLDDLMHALTTYKAYIESPDPSQRRADELFMEFDQLLPHANLGDLYFYGEKERSDDEVIREGIIREHIWRTQGQLAYLMYLSSQMSSALEDVSISDVGRQYASETLREALEEIQRIKGAV